MKNDSSHEHPDFFKGKYDHENFVTRPIIGNFFSTVGRLVPSSVNSILEVGCGPGHSSERLSRMLGGKKYEASDVDPTLVGYAKERNPTMNITLESIYELNHGDASYDLAMSLEVFEHLEDPESALAELHRVTKRYVILSVPNEPLWRILNVLRGKYWSALGNTPGHINHWSTESFIELVSGKFRVIEVRKPIPWTVVVAEKVEEKS